MWGSLPLNWFVCPSFRTLTYVHSPDLLCMWVCFRSYLCPTTRYKQLLLDVSTPRTHICRLQKDPGSVEKDLWNFLRNDEPGHKNKGEAVARVRKTVGERRNQFKSRWECDLGKAANYKEEGPFQLGKLRKTIFPNHTISFLYLILTDQILLEETR